MWERHEGDPIQSPAPMFLTLKGLYPLGSDQLTKSMSNRNKERFILHRKSSTKKFISDYLDSLVSTVDKKGKEKRY